MRYTRLTVRALILSVLLIWPLASVSFAKPEFGIGSRWRGREFTISLSDSLQNGSPNINGDIQAALRASIALWEGVADLRIRVAASALTDVDPQGVRGDGTSLLTSAGTAENLKLFPKMERSAPATTRVFRGKGGFIVEADIVLNPFVQFSDDGSPGTFDLQTVLTHEIGHFLGLEHSRSLSSVMYEKTGRNVDEPTRRPATLTWADRSAIRDIYGVRSGDLTCCGTVVGRIPLPTRRQTSSVWAEDTVSGRLAAVTQTDKDGSFKLGGIEEGRYRIFAQMDSRDSTATTIGEFELTPDGLVNVPMIKSPSGKEGGVEFIGTDDRMFALPIVLGRGRISELFAGGRSFEPGSSEIGFTGAGILVTALSSEPLEYARDILAKAVRVAVDGSVVPGEYNLFTHGPNGGRHYLLGAVSVR